jgi:hypothetical protein
LTSFSSTCLFRRRVYGHDLASIFDRLLGLLSFQEDPELELESTTWFIRIQLVLYTTENWRIRTVEFSIKNSVLPSGYQQVIAARIIELINGARLW